MPDAFTGAHRAPIILAAARNSVPAVYGISSNVREGGLLSYGFDTRDTRDIWRRAATYVDRILRGEKPGDLPVQFPTKFEMAVNLKTAKRCPPRFWSAPTRSSNNCWLCQFMALNDFRCGAQNSVGIGGTSDIKPGPGRTEIRCL